MKLKVPWRLLVAALALTGLSEALLRPAWHLRSAPARGPRVAFYQDSMHPWIKSDRPAKCTVCGMDLTPIPEGGKGFASGEGLVVLSSNSLTVLQVQTEPIARRSLSRVLRVAGTLEANEAREAVVSAPGPGRVEALTVRSVGEEVQEGQPLASFFSPEWAQTRRYLRRAAALSPAGPSNTPPATAAKADPFTSDLVAPLSGTVVERAVLDGQYVEEGARLLTIADLSVLWFRFDVYEQQLPWCRVGQRVAVTVPAVPGQVFWAAISLIEPALDRATRAVKVRAELKNPVVMANGCAQRLLRLGMYAEGRVETEAPGVVTVPRSALLLTGGHAHAYVDQGGGAFERRRVSLGRQGDDAWEVLDGLEEGERVASSGTFLIDAQAQLASADPAPPAFAAPTTPGEPAGAGAETDDGATPATRAPANPGSALSKLERDSRLAP